MSPRWLQAASRGFAKRAALLLHAAPTGAGQCSTTPRAIFELFQSNVYLFVQ